VARTSQAGLYDLVGIGFSARPNLSLRPARSTSTNTDASRPAGTPCSWSGKPDFGVVPGTCCCPQAQVPGSRFVKDLATPRPRSHAGRYTFCETTCTKHGRMQPVSSTLAGRGCPAVPSFNGPNFTWGRRTRSGHLVSLWATLPRRFEPARWACIGVDGRQDRQRPSDPYCAARKRPWVAVGGGKPRSCRPASRVPHPGRSDVSIPGTFPVRPFAKTLSRDPMVDYRP